MHYLIPVIGQRTYEELRNYLKLPVLRKERIIIKVFGTEGSSLKTVDVVPLKLLSSSKKNCNRGPVHTNDLFQYTK